MTVWVKSSGTDVNNNNKNTFLAPFLQLILLNILKRKFEEKFRALRRETHTRAM